MTYEFYVMKGNDREHICLCDLMTEKEAADYAVTLTISMDGADVRYDRLEGDEWQDEIERMR